MLLSPARIEGRAASDNFTPNRRPHNILWFQRIRRRVGFAERRAEGVWARRFGRQSRRVPVTIWRASQTPSESSWINELCPALPFTRSPALWTGVCQLPPTRRPANLRVARDTDGAWPDASPNGTYGPAR